MFSSKLIPNFKCIRYSRPNSTTVDKSEIELFETISSDWWDETGVFKPLHSFNKLRIPFIREALIQNGSIKKEYIDTPKPFKQLKILDIGCGGGILSEPLSRLGAEVTGLDANKEAIKKAKAHSERNKLHNISYLTSSIEVHAKENRDKYDAVVASEVIEHITDKEYFIETCVKCLKPGGSIVFTTLSKTFLADILAIGVAECIGLVPKGIHEVEKFIQPHELQRILEKNSCQTKLVHGMCYDFLRNTWIWISNTSINYGLTAVKLG